MSEFLKVLYKLLGTKQYRRLLYIGCYELLHRESDEYKRLGRLSYSGWLLYPYNVEVGQQGANVWGDMHRLHQVSKS